MKVGGNVKIHEFSGRLIGGCIDCLVTLCGTGFDKVSEFNEKYKKDGFIWFLESCDLNPISVRRAVWQLDNAGWFKYMKGVLVGRPYRQDIPEAFGLNYYDSITGVLGKYDVPILMDLDIGHLPPTMPIISGALADVKTGDNSISIKYRWH